MIAWALRDDELATTDAGGTFEIRDAEPGDGRTISGVAVPYRQVVSSSTREYGNAAETFEPGAFRDAIAAVEAGERLPIVDEHHGTVVGYADRLWDEPDGLHYSGRLLEVPEAASFAARVAARVLRVSIEFLPGEIRRAANAVAHVRVRRLGAIAGSYAPAYLGSSISVRSVEDARVNTCSNCGVELVEGVTHECALRGPAVAAAAGAAPIGAGGLAVRQAEGAAVVSQGDMVAIATRITDEAIRNYAARQAFGSAIPADPFAEWRGLSLGAMAQRTIGQAEGELTERRPTREDREWLRWAIRSWADRTIADTVTTSGANAGMVTPGVIGDVHGIVSRGRRAITAFGGPRSSEGSGLSVDWPYFDGTLTSLVGAQSAEKAEITSAAVNVKKGTEALATYAGGSDISYQLLRKSTRAYLDVYFRILLTAWAVVTDAAFVTELESGSVTSDFAEALASVDATEFKNLVIDASLAVETATGLPAEFVLASTTAFAQFAKLFTPITSLAGSAATGTLDLRSLQVNVGLLPVIHVPSITAGKLIVSNREAAAWYEEGPFQAQDEDVMHLGKDVAIWSMGAGARFIPAGIVEMYDVTP